MDSIIAWLFAFLRFPYKSIHLHVLISFFFFFFLFFFFFFRLGMFGFFVLQMFMILIFLWNFGDKSYKTWVIVTWWPWDLTEISRKWVYLNCTVYEHVWVTVKTYRVLPLGIIWRNNRNCASDSNIIMKDDGRVVCTISVWCDSIWTPVYPFAS